MGRPSTLRYVLLGRMLVNPRTQDHTGRKGRRVILQAISGTFPLFQKLTEMTRANEWFSEGNDCAGVKAAPLDLKVLGICHMGCIT